LRGFAPPPHKAGSHSPTPASAHALRLRPERASFTSDGPSRVVELEDLNSLFWPLNCAPFGLEVLVLENRSLQVRARRPYVHNHHSGLRSDAVVSFGAVRSHRYRISKGLVITGQQLLRITLSSEDHQHSHSPLPPYGLRLSILRPNGSRQLDLPLLTRLVRVEGIVLGSISTDPLAGIGVRDW
jgi:hypothetical protein